MQHSQSHRPRHFFHGMTLIWLLLLGACTSQPASQPAAVPQTAPAITATTAQNTAPAATPVDKAPATPVAPAAAPAAPVTPTPVEPPKPAPAKPASKPTPASQPEEKTPTTQPAAPATPAPAALPQQLQQEHHLEPFKASFRIYVSKIPMPITAELELTPQAQPDTWKMRFEVNSFLLHNLEESTFTWNNCRPKSIHYHHDFKGFGKHQFHDTSFYWNPPHVENHSDEDNSSFPIPEHSVDDLTVLLQAACVFSEGATDYYATSIYGNQIRDNHFKLLRHETINTPLGKLDTLVVEKARDHDNGRNTLFWIAPKLNYMLVKAKHIENPVLFGEVIMKSYSGPHQPESN